MLTVCTSYEYRRHRQPRILHWLFAAFCSREKKVDVAAHRYEIVMRRYGNMVAGICWAYACCEDDFQDLRQDVCLNIFRGLEQYRGEAELKTWIYRVTLNTCITGYRHRKRWDNSGTSLESVAEPSADAYSRFEDAEFLHRLLHTLSIMDRSIILLWLDEHSYDEIAEIMGMKRNTVASRLRRIKSRLAINASKI